MSQGERLLATLRLVVAAFLRDHREVFRGKEGKQGVSGERGEMGDKGDPGKDGKNGKDGLQGEQGPQGFKGEDGKVGEQGPRGERGDTGLRGLSGIRGEKGERGKDGKNALPIRVIGAPGPRGSAGANGTPGVGVPAGGGAGQVLLKLGGSDYDTQWAAGLTFDATTNRLAVNYTGTKTYDLEIGGDFRFGANGVSGSPYTAAAYAAPGTLFLVKTDDLLTAAASFFFADAGNAASTYGVSNFGMGPNTLTGSSTDTTTEYNVAIGGFTLGSISSGAAHNGIVGSNSFGALTSGQYNSGLGDSLGTTLSTGSFNSLFGAGADVSDGAATARTVLGLSAIGDTDNQVFLGDANVTAWVPGATGVASVGRSDRHFADGYFDSIHLGTYTAGILLQAGYITIKDAGGTNRRLLVG